MRLDLNGKWQMRRTDEVSWQDAQVPGSVLNDLYQNGRIADPYYRDNEETGYAVSRYEYVYRKSFDLTAEDLEHDRLLLRCEGLDTLCDVMMNGQTVLKADNMHRIWETDVKQNLQEGKNRIEVLIHSATAYLDELNRKMYDPRIPDEEPALSHLRKAAYAYGWDWGPKLGDQGIWRGISVRSYDRAKLEDVYVRQEHLPGQVKLRVQVGIQKWKDGEYQALAQLESPAHEKWEGSVEFFGDQAELEISVNHPLLWWPNRLGDQPLYGLTVTLTENGVKLDEQEMKIGLRTIALKKEDDKWGQSFTFVVNGEEIFAMGANYIPEDAMLGRRTEEKTRRMLADCRNANYNMIRVWGGGHYAEDAFYDLCDEYGILVWQDHMYACRAYEFTEELKKSITQETVDNVKRLRNHACLALWCGNNEIEMLWANFGFEKRYGAKMKDDYLEQFESYLPRLTGTLDPATPYWHSSPSSVGHIVDTDNENFGDTHYWGVWHGQEPLTNYRNIYPRFNSEFGIQSFPCLKTMKTFTALEDRNIFSEVCESHQKNGTGNEKILFYISENFRYPYGFDSLLYVSQLVQAEGMRYGVEHWRRNRGRCMGALIWQLNDCWPVASWSCVDYDNRWKAVQYMAKRFYAPVLLSACEEGKTAALHVTNDTGNAVLGSVHWELRHRDGKVLNSGDAPVEVPGLSTRQVVKLDFGVGTEGFCPREDFLSYALYKGKQAVSSGICLFVKNKHFELKEPHIKVETMEEEDAFIITLRSDSLARFVELDLTDADAVFEDNIFDLEPGKEKRIGLEKNRISRRVTLEEIRQQLKIRSLYDTFEKVM